MQTILQLQRKIEQMESRERNRDDNGKDKTEKLSIVGKDKTEKTTEATSTKSAQKRGDKKAKKREAKLKGTQLLPSAPKPVNQLQVWVGDIDLGFVSRVKNSSTGHEYYDFPKHFFDDYDVIYIEGPKGKIPLTKSDVALSSKTLDQGLIKKSWLTKHPETASHVKCATIGVTKTPHNPYLLVQRNKQWFYSPSASPFVPQNAHSSEESYMCPTEAGDCGSSVWFNNMVEGIHVSTLGKDVANCFKLYSPSVLVDLEELFALD